ncbi:MAG: hypothetical protein ACREF4_14635 [Gammaproteobacteria bacterium]
MNDKYEFTGETQTVYGCRLQRIRRKCDGVLGGWTAFETNLAAYGEAQVYGEAWVRDKALVYGEAQVCPARRGWANPCCAPRAPTATSSSSHVTTNRG